MTKKQNVGRYNKAYTEPNIREELSEKTGSAQTLKSKNFMTQPIGEGGAC